MAGQRRSSGRKATSAYRGTNTRTGKRGRQRRKPPGHESPPSPTLSFGSPRSLGWRKRLGMQSQITTGRRSPPKKSCMDRTRNALARCAAQIRTRHWRSAVFLKRIKKRRGDKCWLCHGSRMTRSHSSALLNYVQPGRRRGGKDPGSVRVLLSSRQFRCPTSRLAKWRYDMLLRLTIHSRILIGAKSTKRKVSDVVKPPRVLIILPYSMQVRSS